MSGDQPAIPEEDAWWLKDSIDLGNDHWFKFVYNGGERVGGIIAHRKPDGSMCWGSIAFDVPKAKEIYEGRPSWTVQSWDPLSCQPSFQCTACPDHGFITDGKWIRA